MADGTAARQDDGLVWGSAQGRWVLVATVLGSGIAFLDSTIVNVALPTIGEEFDSPMSGLQWTTNAYMLTLASLILLGGSLGDRFGRRRVFSIGVAWFAVASLLCGLALNMPMLIAARALQGVGGALLTPGSLAILQASFREQDRPTAIGAWSGLGGIATAAGPFLGGYLVTEVSWRWAFLINLPLAIAVIAISARHVPESSDPTSVKQLDFAGASLGAIGLGGTTYALIQGAEGTGSPLTIVAAAVIGVAAMAGFVVAERRGSHPMLPLDIFASSQFSFANLVTFVVYGALGAAMFLLALNLQQVVGYSPLQAGIAFMPMTVVMFLLSARAGRLAGRIGPRLPMTVGPIVAGVGLAMMSRILAGSTYVGDVLPAVIVFGLGLSLVVAPLTSTVLAAADARHSGVASGVNNAVARSAQLIAVAVVPVAAGMTGAVYENPGAFSAAYQRGVLGAAVVCILGGVLAYATIRNPARTQPDERADYHCAAAGGPPLRTGATTAGATTT